MKNEKQIQNAISELEKAIAALRNCKSDEVSLNLIDDGIEYLYRELKAAGVEIK